MAQSTAVRMPHAAVVERVIAADGAHVARGDPLFVISAMKMETVVASPCAGMVRLRRGLRVGTAQPAKAVVVTVISTDTGTTTSPTATTPPGTSDNTTDPSLTPTPFAVSTPASTTPRSAPTVPVDGGKAGAAQQPVQGEGTPPPSAPRTWAAEVDRLRTLQRRAAGGGGAARAARQRKAGKLTARERVSLWCHGVDPAAAAARQPWAPPAPEAFREIGSAAGIDTDDFGRPCAFTPVEVVGGIAVLQTREAPPSDRHTVLLIDDFTVRGSHTSGDAATMRKRSRIEGVARELRLPLVRVLDGASGGGTVTAGLRLGAAPVPALDIRETVALLNAGIPVVACLAGPVVGLGALRAGLAHLCIGIRNVAQLFAAGPPVVAAASGDTTAAPPKEALGGMDGIAGPAGAVDVIVNSEPAARAAAIAFLDYVWWRRSASEWAAPSAAALIAAIPTNPRAAFDMRGGVLAHIFDVGSFFEIGGGWGTAAITGFARVEGRAVGVYSCDCRGAAGGTWAAEECRKMARFARLCETFDVPLVGVVDHPGLAVGVPSEASGTIRAGAELTTLLYSLKVPCLPIVVRRCFGVGGALVVDPPGLRLAWPSAAYGSLPSAGGVEAIAKGDPAHAAAIRAHIQKLQDPLRTAQRFSIDEVIDPRDTRAWIRSWLASAASGRGGRGKL